MSWDTVERWAERHVKVVGFALVVMIGIMGVANAAAI